MQYIGLFLVVLIVVVIVCIGIREVAWGTVTPELTESDLHSVQICTAARMTTILWDDMIDDYSHRYTCVSEYHFDGDEIHYERLTGRGVAEKGFIFYLGYGDEGSFNFQ